MFFPKSYFLLFSLCCCSASLAQSRIEGQVRNGKSERLAYANVLLLHAVDSTFIQGVVSNDEGKYVMENVKPGSYILVSSLVGYKKTYAESFTINEVSTLLKDVKLEDHSVELNEVLVEAEKPMFEQKLDRLVVNVQNSITSAGNTALEVLQKSPGVLVNRQNNTLSLNGKSGVRVMMNGKLMQLPIEAVIQMLDGMTAANIEKIELITTPPARYDAEGDAGIIHIVLKESADIGTSGSITSTLGYQWAETAGGNVSVNHRSKKAGYFLDYSYNRNHNRHFWKSYRQSVENGFDQLSTDTSDRKNIVTAHNLRVGAEWKIGKRSSLNALVTMFDNVWSMHALTRNNNQQDVATNIYTIMFINEKNHNQSSTAGLRWTTQLTDKSDVAIDLDYVDYRNNNPSDYTNDVRINSVPSNSNALIDVKKSTPIHFLIGKVDYTARPTEVFSIEAGGKFVVSDLDNDVKVNRFSNGEWTSDARFTSFAHLEENIAAGYVSGKYFPASDIQVSGGIRYEHTNTIISTPADGVLLDRNYGYFFPSFFIQKDLAKNKDILFSYSRRITRPTFRDIAPFVFFWNPNTFSAGNTSLWPAVSDNVKVGLHVKSWILSLQYNHSRREISFFQPELDPEENTMIYRSQNLRYLNSFGLTNTYSFNVVKWWEVQSNFTAQFQKAQTEHLDEDTSLEVYNFNANVVNILTLPRNFSVELSGFYNSRSVLGISEFQPRGAVNLGIQKKFRNNYGTLRFGVDDIFYNSAWELKTNLPQLDFRSTLVYDWHMQAVRLTYTWSFGNKKLRSVNIQSGSEEEQRRVK